MAEGTLFADSSSSPETELPLHVYPRHGIKRSRSSSPPLPVKKAVRRTQSFSTPVARTKIEFEGAMDSQIFNSRHTRTRFSFAALHKESPTEIFLANMSSPFAISQRPEKQRTELGPDVRQCQGQSLPHLETIENNGSDSCNYSDEIQPCEMEDREVHGSASNPGHCEKPSSCAADEVDTDNNGASKRCANTIDKFSTRRSRTYKSARTQNIGQTGMDGRGAPKDYSPTRVRHYRLLSVSPTMTSMLKTNDYTSCARKHLPSPDFEEASKAQTHLGMLGSRVQYGLVGRSFKAIRATTDRPDGSRKEVGDGFTSQEAHPNVYRKTERRVKDSPNRGLLGGLELAGGMPTEQNKMKGPTWLRGQRKTKTIPAATIWEHRQHIYRLETSIDTHDPIEAANFTEQLDPETTSYRGRLRRNLSEIIDNEDEIDLSAPSAEIFARGIRQNGRCRALTPDSDESLILCNSLRESPMDALTFVEDEYTPEKYVRNTSCGEELDPWKADHGDAQFPAKPMWNELCRDGKSLSLRPDPNEWVRMSTQS